MEVEGQPSTFVQDCPGFSAKSPPMGVDPQSKAHWGSWLPYMQLNCHHRMRVTK